MSEWQLIGENWCPPFGTEALLYKAGHVYSARWVHSEVMGPVWATPDGHVILRASHHMPLPPPPEQAGG